MRRLVVTAAVLLAGCGRFGFDGTADAMSGTDAPDARPCDAIGHDEDGDGVDDACDACPHRAGSQLDGDGDGVGDDCDLAPTSQTWTLFDPFTELRPAWMFRSGAVIVGDSLHLPAAGSGGGMTMVEPPGRVILETAGRVGTTADAGDRQIAIHFGVDASTYYCELYDDGVQPLAFALTYTLDGVVFTNIERVELGGRLETGTFRMTVVHEPPDSIGCSGSWNGSSVTAGGTIPAGISADAAHVAVNNADVELDYFVRLATP